MSKEPTLKEVLAKINAAVDDFASRPATSVQDKGAFGDYPLHKAAILGDIEAAQVLLNNGADVNAQGEDDDTALHRAIGSEKFEMVKLLVEFGADVDLRNRYGDSSRDDGLESADQRIKQLFRNLRSGRP